VPPHDTLPPKSPFRLRPAEPRDADTLLDALCQAVNWSPAWKPQSRQKVLQNPNFNKYVTDWPRPGDWGVIAEAARPFGAAWLRLFPADAPGYGFVAPDVPELTIGVLPGWRGHGMGTRLLTALFKGPYDQISLSVERANPARELYVKLGFTTVESGPDADTMLRTR
jgi:ribosomal protein S18 acetylase RimI-like enzyme